MSASEKVHGLAIEYFGKSNQLIEQRRQIDYDMAKHLKILESKNQTVNGKLAVLDYKDKIANEEKFYLQLKEDLRDISEDFWPLLVAVNAIRNEELETIIGDNIYIDTYIDELGAIICRGPFTKIN